jgi:hypothetical protein
MAGRFAQQPGQHMAAARGRIVEQAVFRVFQRPGESHRPGSARQRHVLCLDVAGRRVRRRLI